MALNWFTSYLSDRSFSVRIGSSSSKSAPIKCGIPRGSILGPLLFSLYMLPLGSIFEKYGIQYHCYADDTQFYIPIKSDDASSMTKVLDCLNDIQCWMSRNFLQLNENKTEVILFGPPNQVSDLKKMLGPLSPNYHSIIKNLSVYFDTALNFNKQISNVVKSSFYQLRTIAKIKSFFTLKDLQTLIHAFITSRLDYCNSMYTGLTQSNLGRLQLVQNAAARLLTGTKKRQHITPVLVKLHWLPIKFRIDFKLLLFVFKVLNGLASQYVKDLITPYSALPMLRSSSQNLLTIPFSHKKSSGDRAFSVAGPRLWNDLPQYGKGTTNISSFKLNLKAYLLFFGLQL
ncbi:hypothetical protein ACEWY4_001234 [Coilia grayii]|uniref:Reverse transcriptase domain-containing protein n=1 Tax=Coilia grayii TaxID=363190 RepID=A0ABD1KYX1_9TELE